MKQTEHFSLALTELMEQRGETQRSLGAKVGVSFSTVSRWQNGTIPRKGKLSKIAKALGTTTDHLLGSGTNETSILAEQVLHYEKVGTSKPANFETLFYSVIEKFTDDEILTRAEELISKGKINEASFLIQIVRDRMAQKQKAQK